MRWLLAIPAGAIVGCVIGSYITPESELDDVKGDFVAQKLKEYYSKPYGDMQTVADVYGITPANENSLEFLR